MQVATLYNLCKALQSFHVRGMVHCSLAPPSFSWFQGGQGWKVAACGDWAQAGMHVRSCYQLRYASPEVMHTRAGCVVHCTVYQQHAGSGQQHAGSRQQHAGSGHQLRPWHICSQCTLYIVHACCTYSVCYSHRHDWATPWIWICWQCALESGVYTEGFKTAQQHFCRC